MDERADECLSKSQNRFSLVNKGMLIVNKQFNNKKKNQIVPYPHPWNLCV